VPANGEGMEERDAVCGGGKDAYLDLERDVACRARRAVGRHCEAGDGVDAAALGSWKGREERRGPGEPSEYWRRAMRGKSGKSRKTTAETEMT
jgi:DNA-directed RNA polymerase specialized sigma24 family protein